MFADFERGAVDMWGARVLIPAAVVPTKGFELVALKINSAGLKSLGEAIQVERQEERLSSSM